MLREVLARFGIDVESGQILTGINSLRDFASAALQAARILGTALFDALRSLTVEMAEFGDEAAKTARQLGISADELLRWRFAAERSGVPAEQLTNGLRRLQRNIVDAGEGTETARRAFAGIGVAFQDGAGNAREIEDILPEIADGFAGLSNDTERSARAQQLFGRAGAQLLPFFEGGSEGLEEMSARFDELTGGSFGNFFEAAEEAQDSMADFELATTAVKASLATELLPVLTSVVTGIADFVGLMTNATRGTRPFRVILLGLAIAIAAVATAITVVLLPALLPFLLISGLMAAALAFVVLAIDDFLTFLEGGDSIIGRSIDAIQDFIDTMFGAGTSTTAIREIQAAWTDTVRVLREELMPVFRDVVALMIELWPTVRPLLFRLVGFFLSFGRFLIGPFLNNVRLLFRAFLAGLQALPNAVRNTIQTVVAVFTAVHARVVAIANQIQALINRVTGAASGILGVLGIDVNATTGAAPGAGPGASVRADGGAKSTTVEQTNEITINGTDLSASELQTSVLNAIEESRQRALRVAERALTTVAG